MRIYYLWASTYESVELMEKHHESDYALELLSRRVSDPFHVLAESPQDAAEQFQESTQFEAFYHAMLANRYLSTIRMILVGLCR